ncbi:MAG TPA: hypothetical protein VKQ11_22930 [Candidatus Sulfotelmatobacter sp.]|nr:hypothetical protein [Candidatus Sulfotelmatobacter sp.]
MALPDETRIIRSKKLFEQTILPENRDQIAQLFDDPKRVLELITGMLAVDKQSLRIKIGHFAQSILQGNAQQQINREIKELREKGKIRDFTEDERGTTTWAELMKEIDDGIPDTDKLAAMKIFFIEINRVNATDESRMLNYQLFKIAKNLDSGKLLILKAAYAIKGDVGTGEWGIQRWATAVAKKLGHGLTALVLKDESTLMELGLISPHRDRTVGLPNQIAQVDNGRLTDLGIKLCETIQNYQAEE